MSDQPSSTILNVNDDASSRYVVTRMLQRAGFHVKEASTGGEALRLAAEDPDLVILDVDLPDISGLEVCRRLKETPATASVTVLHLSAHSVTATDRVLGLEGGADAYLTQPVEAAELLATVRALLRMRKAEEVVRASAQQWRATFDAISDGVCMLDRNGNVRRCNSAMAQLLRKSFRQIVGRAYLELAQEGLGPFDATPLTRMQSTRSRQSVELPIGERWFRVTADPIFAAGGEVDGTVHILADITERKQLEEELRQRADALADADRRKDEFLAMLAHELRNPLAPILSAAQLIRMRVPGEPALQRARDVVERQVQHMARLLDDLLEVSRITRGQVELRKERVDLQMVIAHAAQTSRPLVDVRGHALSIDAPPEPIWLEADPTRLEQVVVNLLNNAAKYTEPGGRIALTLEIEPSHCGASDCGSRIADCGLTMGTEPPLPDNPQSAIHNPQSKGSAIRNPQSEAWAVLRLRDTGKGIPAEVLPRVFDLFVQSERTLDRSEGGLGIGLTLVKKLVEMHGGTVTASSDGPGRGSEFVVRLPVTEYTMQSNTLSTRHDPQSAIRNPQSRRVLVVEDNLDAADTLADLLKLLGHEVRVAYDGPTALEVAAGYRPEVVLLDIGLPVMDGYEVARGLRQDAHLGEAHLVALTGYGQAEDRRRSREAGFDHHLVKPVDLAAVQALLEEE